MQTLDGPAAVLAATHHHPYTRFAVGVASDVHGLTDGAAVPWRGPSPSGWIGHGLGDVSTVVDVVAGTDIVDGVRWINPPRHEPFGGFALNEDWDLLRVAGPVPAQPGRDRVVRLEPDAAPTAVPARLGSSRSASSVMSPSTRSTAVTDWARRSPPSSPGAYRPRTTWSRSAVMADHDPAIRVYDRLGYTDRHRVTSVHSGR